MPRMVIATIFSTDFKSKAPKVNCSGIVYGSRLNQRVKAKTSPMATTQDRPPIMSTRRLRRNSQSVEGTITRTPSHAVWRAVPPNAFSMAATLIQAVMEFSVPACTARKHIYRQSTVQNTPEISVMKPNANGTNIGDSTNVMVASVAFQGRMPARTKVRCTRYAVAIATINVLNRTAVKEKPNSLAIAAPRKSCQPSIGVSQPL